MSDDDDIAVTIVAADVTPIERAATDERREERGDAAAKETVTDGAEPHPLGL